MNTGRYQDRSIEEPRMQGKYPKLTKEQAAEIIRRHELGKSNTVSIIAKDFGVGRQLILDLVNGYRPKHWKP